PHMGDELGSANTHTPEKSGRVCACAGIDVRATVIAPPTNPLVVIWASPSDFRRISRDRTLPQSGECAEDQHARTGRPFKRGHWEHRPQVTGVKLPICRPTAAPRSY